MDLNDTKQNHHQQQNINIFTPNIFDVYKYTFFFTASPFFDSLLKICTRSYRFLGLQARLCFPYASLSSTIIHLHHLLYTAVIFSSLSSSVSLGWSVQRGRVTFLGCLLHMVHIPVGLMRGPLLLAAGPTLQRSAQSWACYWLLQSEKMLPWYSLGSVCVMKLALLTPADQTHWVVRVVLLVRIQIDVTYSQHLKMPLCACVWIKNKNLLHA